MAQKWYQKATVQRALAGAIGGGLLGVLGTLLSLYATGQLQENQRLRETITRWRFSEPLYRKLPGDIDFLARGLRIDKRQGGEVSVLGPSEGDRFIIIVSELRPLTKLPNEPQHYSIEFTVQGSVVGDNWIRGGTSGLMPVAAHALSDPINAGKAEFFIFVDKVDVDYVYVSLARRRTNLSIEYSVIPFGVLNFRTPQGAAILGDAPPTDAR